MKVSLSCAGLLAMVCGGVASAQGIGFPEYPSISPDGSIVVFTWAEDLWAVPRAGGAAVCLTSHPATERVSAFSPDGATLAFESDRNGARNLHVMPIALQGGLITVGEVRPVTAIDRPQTLTGWSHDGQWLLFTGQLEPSMYRGAHMYRAPLAGGPIERLTPAFGYAAHAMPDGAGYVFTRGGNEWERPGYNGSADRDVWRFTTGDGQFIQVSTPDCNDGEGYQLPDGSIVFLSARDGQNNLYRLAPGATDPGTPEGPGISRLTVFKPAPGETTIASGVRDFSVSPSGQAAVFCVWDSIYTLDLSVAGAMPQKIELHPSADTQTPDLTRINIGNLASEVALSPDGKTVALIARGEVFVRSVEENRPTRRVTTTYGRESDLTWSPDGSTLYFTSDESGTQGIYQAKVALSREDLDPKKPEPPAAEEPKPEQGAPAPSGDAAAIAGTWNCVARGGPPLPPVGAPFTLTRKAEGGSISGTVDAPGFGSAPINGASYDAAGKKLTFTITLAGNEAQCALMFEGASLSGTITVQTASFQISGTRAGGGELAFDGFGRREDQCRPADGDGRRAGSPPDSEPEGTDSAPDVQPANPEPAKPAEEKPKSPPKPDLGKRWAESITFEVSPFVDTDAIERAARISADGRHMIYIRGYGDAVLRHLGTGDERVVLSGWDEPEIVWAGDSRHVFYAVQDLDFNSDVWVLDALDEAAKPVNITRHPDLDFAPRVSADGKVLVFLSDRQGENFDFNVWWVYLDKSLEGLDAYDLAEHFKKAGEEAKKAKPIDPVDFAAAWTPPEGQRYDTDDAYLRARRITSFPGSQGSLLLSPAGDRVVFSGSIDGAFGLFSIDYKGGDRKSVTTGAAGDVRLTPKGDMVTFVSGGQGRAAGIAGGRAETYAIAGTIDIETSRQQRQKFLEAARILETRFYEGSLNGLDWPATVIRYAALASQTRTGAAFNRIARMLMGELDGSHLGISGGDGDGFSAPALDTGYLGVDVTSVPGGYRVDAILEGSPAQRNKTPLLVGDIIAGVDGRPVVAGPEALPALDIREAMNGTGGREVLLDIRRASEPERTRLLITPVGYGTIAGLGYDAELKRRRELVDRLSDGRIGYLHIRSMSEPSTREFERDLFAAADGKIGLLIDVRDNGGGSTADILLASLTAPMHAFTVPRGARKEDAFPNAYPRDRRLIYPYQRPITVLINENSYSNAEIFAHAIRTIGRGKLAGTETFGAVISTGAAGLIDGSSVRTPFRGWYLPDGTDMEEFGAPPDINVPQLPQDEAAGRDRQIEEAVAELLERAAASPDGLWKPGR